jgi:hypothetical protein
VYPEDVKELVDPALKVTDPAEVFPVLVPDIEVIKLNAPSDTK